MAVQTGGDRAHPEAGVLRIGGKELLPGKEQLMKKRLLASIVTAAAVAASVAAAPAPASASGSKPPTGERSLATVLAADGQKFDRNWYDFDIVDKAVATVLGADKNSPVGILADGSKPVTAFLPTDRAFQNLVKDLTGSRPATEKATFDTVATLGVPLIEQVLLYHVVKDSTITYRQALGADGAALPTALGPTLGVDVRYHWFVFLEDQNDDSRDARVLLFARNINKHNLQIAHGITQVLLPKNL
jgi:hypothetical protein